VHHAIECLPRISVAKSVADVPFSDVPVSGWAVHSKQVQRRHGGTAVMVNAPTAQRRQP
jgi:hypothetical protein